VSVGRSSLRVEENGICVSLTVSPATKSLNKHRLLLILPFKWDQGMGEGWVDGGQNVQLYKILV